MRKNQRDAVMRKMRLMQRLNKCVKVRQVGDNIVLFTPDESVRLTPSEGKGFVVVKGRLVEKNVGKLKDRKFRKWRY